MTEKRFYTDGQYVMQKGEVWVVAGGEHNADVIATALNELIEERNKLQFNYNMEVLTRQSIEKKNEKLKKKILEEIDLEVTYVNETYSEGRMSKEQHDGAIISLRQLREKFE